LGLEVGIPSFAVIAFADPHEAEVDKRDEGQSSGLQRVDKCKMNLVQLGSCLLHRVTR